MSGAWEIREQRKVLLYTIHCETTTLAWAAGFRNLIIPGSYIFLSGMPYDHSRNSAVQQFLASPFEWLFSLDSDVVPPRDAILRLLAHNQPIISGTYFRRSPPHGVPVAIKDGKWLTSYRPGEVVDVDLVGAGCLLVHRSVFERVPPQRPGKNWFDWRVDLKGTGIYPDHECMSEDFTLCFPKGTWVMGKYSKPIEQVKANDRVLTHVGSMQKVLGTISRHYKGEMIQLTTRYLSTITATPAHRFYVRTTRGSGRYVTFRGAVLLNGEIGGAYTTEVGTKKTMWVEAKDIKAGDWLYVPKIVRQNRPKIKTFDLGHFISKRCLTLFPDGTMGYSRTRKNALRMRPTVHVTPDFCRLLGYYIAEGMSSREKHFVTFAFHKDERHTLAADCRRLLKSVFGARSTLVEEDNTDGITVVTSSKLLSRLLAALCGHGSSKKHLPRFWSKLSFECLGQLIKGYWWGDGSYSGRMFNAVTISERLARELQGALLRMNVLCGVRTRTSNDGYTAYRLHIPISLSQRMADIVDYRGDITEASTERTYLRETKTHFLVKVRSIEKTPFDGEVYNLTVDKTESYTANGVAVHNCQHWKKHGLSVLLDTGVQCRHVGLSQAGPGTMLPLETMPAA